MRRFVVPLLALLSPCAFGQLSVGDQQVQNGLQALNSATTIFTQLSGTEAFNGAKNYLNDSAYFNLSVTGDRVLAQVEVVCYNAGKPYLRIVGDGVTLWRYDYLNNTYSATVYGTYSGPQPYDYSNTFFRYLSAISEGYISYQTLLLKQIYGTNGASYQSWMPGITPVVDAEENVTYSMGQPPRRTITFSFGLAGVMTGSLQSISYDDVANVGRSKKTIDWSMTIVSNLAIDPLEFKFVPPAQARLIAGPRISGTTPVATSGVGTTLGH